MYIYGDLFDCRFRPALQQRVTRADTARYFAVLPKDFDLGRQIDAVRHRNSPIAAAAVPARRIERGREGPASAVATCRPARPGADRLRQRCRFLIFADAGIISVKRISILARY